MENSEVFDVYGYEHLKIFMEIFGLANFGDCSYAIEEIDALTAIGVYSNKSLAIGIKLEQGIYNIGLTYYAASVQSYSFVMPIEAKLEDILTVMTFAYEGFLNGLQH